MPSYYYDDDAGGGDADAVMVNNPKLEAIQEVKAQAQTSQSNLREWAPASTTGSAAQYSETFDAGLSDEVWTSPVADDYRTKIDAADSKADGIIEGIISDLTDAENAIYDAGQDRVPQDSPLANWPNT
ncbi:hypothetical protein [Actinomyces sp.]|uniref:hypothetical protein n=1 Tax=Actinomyces sp. TaxID=29317 RepID=UPI0026DAB4F3|nr:hypothetical protein [Actinomyces sp.]MDO4901194.1 hypothetical protein [Actinomyces sp.]